MNTSTVEGEKLWKKGWELLKRGVVDKRHDYNLAVLCSVNAALHPRSRTLVLRKALEDKGELWCYTDKRSEKAKAVTAGRDTLSWTFWSPRHKIQFSGSGKSHWLGAEESQQLFASLPRHSRKAYATLSAPGSPATDRTNGLPTDWEERSLAATDYAADNFGVLITHLTEVEILFLSRDGHQRLSAKRLPFRTWELQWLVP
jgi:pyridoxine/pyridoxamine 5'-phosphate oxidase